VTTLLFTREAVRVEAMRLGTSRDMDRAQDWLHAHGVAASVLNGVLRARAWDGLRLTVHLGQWLCYEPATGVFEVRDGDEHGPDGCVGGLGVVGQ